MLMARRCGEPVEVSDATTETTQEWALPSGEVRRGINAAPVRVRQGETWTPVNLDLIERSDGAITAKAHPDGVTLAGAAEGPGLKELAAVGVGSDRVAFGWEGPLPAPVLDGNTATYADVKPGIDLAVEATVNGLETFYIVKNRAAAAQVTEISVPIAGQEVASHRISADGRLTLLDDDQQKVATSPAPLMWDARTDSGGEPAEIRTMDSEAVSRPATDTSADADAIDGAGVTLQLSPDAAFLAAPSTVYPVTIDPQLTLDDPTWDTWVNEGDTFDHSLDYYAQIGSYNNKLGRAFVNFDVAAFKGKQITDATIGLYNYHSNSCSNINWEIWSVTGSSTSTRWTSQPTWKTKEAMSGATKGGPGGCATAGAGMVYINGVRFFQRQADEQRNIGYMGVRATTESDPASRKNFYSQNYSDPAKSPYAIVTYKGMPALSSRNTEIATNICVTGSTRPIVTTLTPQLNAKYIDPGATTFDASFEYGTLDGTILGSESVTAQPLSAAANVLVAQEKLTEGQSYRWRVRPTAEADSSLPWSSWCEFTVHGNWTTPETPWNGVEDYVAPPDPEAMLDPSEIDPDYIDESEVEDPDAEGEAEASSDYVEDRTNYNEWEPTAGTSSVEAGECPAGGVAPAQDGECISMGSFPEDTFANEVDGANDEPEATIAGVTNTPIGRLGNTPLPQVCRDLAPMMTRKTRYSSCIWHADNVHNSWTDKKLSGQVFFNVYRFQRQNVKNRSWDFHVYFKVRSSWGSDIATVRLKASPSGTWCSNSCKIDMQPVNARFGVIGDTVQISSLIRSNVPDRKRRTMTASHFFTLSRPYMPRIGSMVTSSEVRCDRAMKLTATTLTSSFGCVNPTYTPSLRYKLTGGVADIAEHIQAAQTSGLPGKRPSAGTTAAWVPLRRMYSTSAGKSNWWKSCGHIDDNRNNPSTDNCDEYPFASTYEGARTWNSNAPRTFNFCRGMPGGSPYGPYGYSHCYVNAIQNSRAGTQLGNFYSDKTNVGNRILDNDPFFVDIYN
jgi:hypothetical protein